MIGQINSFFDTLLGNVIQSLSSGNIEVLEKICKDFAASTEYKSICNSFRSPVVNCSKFKEIREKIQVIDDLKKDTQFHDFWQNVKEKLVRYVGSYKPEWDKNSYFIIPVIVDGNDPGLTYLTTGIYPPGVSKKLSYSGLHNNGVDYSSLTGLVLKELYLITHWDFCIPADHESFIQNYYKLYFNAKITEGRSMTAAVISLFCIEFCRNYLGKSDFDAYAAPQNGLLITGDVSEEGKIIPVADVELKIRGAIGEFGTDIKIILPKNSILSDDLRKRLSNLIFVESVSDLFEAILSSNNPNKGLNNIRIKLFEKLNQDQGQKDNCVSHLMPGYPVDIYDKIGVRGYNAFDSIRQKDNIFYTSGSNQKTININISVNRGLLEKGYMNGRPLYIVILDGSYEMNSFWNVTPPEVESKMADIVFEIYNEFDLENNDLYIGFLSSGKFTQLVLGQNGMLIHQTLNRIREEEELITRGAYLRPVYEAVKANYLNRNLKLLVISDSEIHDFDDLRSKRSVQIDRRYLVKGKKDNILVGKKEIDLKGYFNKNTGVFREITIHLGNNMPLCWHPSNAELSFRKNSGYAIKYINISDHLFEFECSMSYTSPKILSIESEVDLGPGKKKKVSFDDILLSKNIQPKYEDSVEIQLTDEDFKLWETICNPTEICSCGDSAVHLSHKQDINLTPVFKSISGVRDSFLLCSPGSRKCYFFKTGMRFGDIIIINLNGSLHYSLNMKEPEPLNMLGSTYCFTHNNVTFYACKFVKLR